MKDSPFWSIIILIFIVLFFVLIVPKTKFVCDNACFSLVTGVNNIQ